VRAEPSADWIDYEDANAGTYRAACFQDGRLEACLFVSPQPQVLSRSWLASLFDKRRLAASERARVLTARPADPRLDTGVTVCACFGVGSNAIEAAIADGCHDPSSIGHRLKAGTNCGSCLPELRRLIRHAAVSSP
jgi:assimilatory nitrate reductase catalytic subunit